MVRTSSLEKCSENIVLKSPLSPYSIVPVHWEYIFMDMWWSAKKQPKIANPTRRIQKCTSRILATRHALHDLKLWRFGGVHGWSFLKNQRRAPLLSAQWPVTKQLATPGILVWRGAIQSVSSPVGEAKLAQAQKNARWMTETLPILNTFNISNGFEWYFPSIFTYWIIRVNCIYSHIYIYKYVQYSNANVDKKANVWASRPLHTFRILYSLLWPLISSHGF